MDPYLTIYRRDYTWPVVATPRIPKCQHEGHKCTCKELIDGPAVRAGAPPVTDSSNYDQPNHYMELLYRKYPFLYEILQTMPPQELVAKVYRDRLRSTYQADYGGEGRFPAQDYEALLGAMALVPPTHAQHRPDDPCRPPMKGPALGSDYKAARDSSFTKGKGPAKGKKEMKKEEDDQGGEKKKAPPICTGRSEYQEAISDLGGRIISLKLHCQPPDDKK